MSFKEIHLPVPWGIIAGKVWGDESKKLVVCLHGFQDNANSFDNLIPLLSNSFCYICLDLPCHGNSSEFATKSLATFFDFVLTLKLVLDYLGKKKYIIMGHSFGGQISFMYTQLYPEYIEKLICLDVVYALPSTPEMYFNRLKKSISYFHKLHNLNKNTAPIYTFEKAVEKMKQGRIVAIEDEAVTCLLSRALEPVGDNAYKFKTSQQLKYMLLPQVSINSIVQSIETNPIICPHLLIKASASLPYYHMMRKVIQSFKNSNKLFETYTVEGNHDVHMQKSEEVANYINKFLITNIHKL